VFFVAMHFVCFWSIATVMALQPNVRFWGNSDRRWSARETSKTIQILKAAAMLAPLAKEQPPGVASAAWGFTPDARTGEWGRPKYRWQPNTTQE
jgi:hypothetical protein